VDKDLRIAVQHHQAGRLQQAAETYVQILQAEPNHVDALHLLGLAHYQAGQHERAVELICRAVALKPDVAEFHNNLGAALYGQGRLDEAAASYERAARLKPDYAEAHVNLGNIKRDQGQLDEAVACYERALQIAPDNAQAHNNLGNAFCDREDFESAAVCFEQALRAAPDFADAYNNFGNALKGLGLFDKALACYERSLEIAPDNATVASNLGAALLSRGKSADAAAACRRAIALDPNCCSAHYYLTASGEEPATEENLARLESLLHRPGATQQDFEFLLHALGMIHGRLGRADLAFESFRAGNAMKHKGLQYCPDAVAAEVQANIEFFDEHCFARLGDQFAVDSQLPIFIVGMPRSGKTTAERALLRCTAVYGAGESHRLTQVIRQIVSQTPSDQAYPGCLDALDGDTGRDLAGEFLGRLAWLAPNAARVADTMPWNFMHLGLIALMWPRATIIHCVRDPMDACFEIYTKYFAKIQPCGWELSHIGHYYRQYERMLDHWRRVLPIRIIEIAFEELIADFEGVSRELIADCGLTVHDGGLASATANDQAAATRKASDSIGRWRNFEKHLEPLKMALSGKPEGAFQPRPVAATE